MNSLHLALGGSEKKDRGLAVWMGAVGAMVFLKSVLREAVEGKRRHSAFKPRGVMPQVQWEQHQPVKSSPSTQIKRLRIHLLPFACVWIGARRRRVEHIKRASPEGELLPVAEDYFPRICEREK